MFGSSLLLLFGIAVLSLFNNIYVINGIIFCDNDYNTSSCANTTLNSGSQYKCRGFLSCKDSTVDNSYNLYCQGDRACKNVRYDNDDNDEMYSLGYRSADSLIMGEKIEDGYCYGYQSCVDIVYDQTTNDNDATAHGYQSMYGAYIDMVNQVDSNGYEGLYSAIINTTSVKDSELDITIYGYYGSYDTDIYCQDGITCNLYAYGYYATEETYLYCLRGSYCNIECGTTSGCQGLSIYAYSTSTVYFNCDDATDCPSLSDAEASAKLMAYSKTAREFDNEFDKIMNDRLSKKQEAQYEFKQERMREEKAELLAIKHSNQLKNEQEWQYTLIQSMMILVIGIVIGMVTTYSYNKCVANKDYSYQSIV